MTALQWEDLKRSVSGRNTATPLVAFIIDSPWLPGFYGIKTIEYFNSGEMWFAANKKAIEIFPDIIFLPGFWSEYGMCTEPSAFGSKCIWQDNDLPHAGKIISDLSDIRNLKQPDPRTEGLLPSVIKRLREHQGDIQAMGHDIRFAIARGPLNIASYLMGTTELMMAMITHPEEIHRLLRIITDFTTDWLQYQKSVFTTIDGIFILDDIVGFVGNNECLEFVVPYLTEIYRSFNASIRFFHNDASGLICSKYLDRMGINLFNFSHEHTFQEIQELTGGNIALMGNLPPRDVLSAGSPEEVKNGVHKMVKSADSPMRIIWSCGGGMPMDVSQENIQIFYNTIVNLF